MGGPVNAFGSFTSQFTSQQTEPVLNEYFTGLRDLAVSGKMMGGKNIGYGAPFIQ